MKSKIYNKVIDKIYIEIRSQTFKQFDNHILKHVWQEIDVYVLYAQTQVNKQLTINVKEGIKNEFL